MISYWIGMSTVSGLRDNWHCLDTSDTALRFYWLLEVCGLISIHGMINSSVFSVIKSVHRQSYEDNNWRGNHLGSCSYQITLHTAI